MNLTPKGEAVAKQLLTLTEQGHSIGLTDADELLEVEGLKLPAGVYLTCERCGELWPATPNGESRE